MKQKFTDLIDVKSIVTILLAGIFSYLAIVDKIAPDQFMLIFAMVMTFYFTKKPSADVNTTETTTITKEDTEV